MADEYVERDIPPGDNHQQQSYMSEHVYQQPTDQGQSSGVGGSSNVPMAFSDFAENNRRSTSEARSSDNQHIPPATMGVSDSRLMTSTDSQECSNLNYMQQAWNPSNIPTRSDFDGVGKTTYNILPEVYKHRQRLSAKYKDSISADKPILYSPLEHQIMPRYPDPARLGYPISRNFQSSSTMDQNLYERMSAVERASIDILTGNYFSENYALRNMQCDGSSRNYPSYPQSNTPVIPHQMDKTIEHEDLSKSTSLPADTDSTQPPETDCNQLEDITSDEETKPTHESFSDYQDESDIEPITMPEVLPTYVPKRPRFAESFTDGVSFEEAQIGLMKTIAFIEANPSIPGNYIETLWLILDHLEKYKNADVAATDNQETTGKKTSKVGKQKKRNKIPGKKTHICPVCNKAFGKRSYLQRHSFLHTGEKPHKCSECDKGFADPWNLRTHMRIHTGEKPFICSTCGKGCSTNGNLQIHMRFHSGERPFECTTCGKHFTQSSTLREHNRTHTGERPYVCSTCGKAFIHSCDLQAHMRTHTGEKPFECLICGKRFAQSSNLHSHEKKHTGAKPFQCEVCGQKFAQKFVLNSHKRVHTGERPYVCSVCTKTFAHSGSLHHHMKMHNKEKQNMEMNENILSGK